MRSRQVLFGKSQNTRASQPGSVIKVKDTLDHGAGVVAAGGGNGYSTASPTVKVSGLVTVRVGATLLLKETVSSGSRLRRQPRQAGW